MSAAASIPGSTVDAAAIIAAGGLVKVSPPATPTSAGTLGQCSEDDDYFYIVVAANTWRRVPLAEWT